MKSKFKYFIESNLFGNVFDGFSTSNETSSSGGNETDFLTGWGESVDGSWFTQVLVVTTSVGMVDWVHSNTSNLWESLSESFEFVEECTSFHDWFFVSSSTGNDTNGSSTEAWNSFSGTWWESDSGFGSIIRMSDNGGISSWTSWISSFVSNGRFDVANGGTFWNSVDWENVTGWDSSFSSTEQILSRISSFGSEEIFGVMLVFIWISEIDFQEWTSSSWVVDDGSNDTFDISLSFNKIKISVSWSSDSLRFGGGINATNLTLSLAWD